MDPDVTNQLLKELTPHIIAVLGALATAFMGWMAAAMARKNTLQEKAQDSQAMTQASDLLRSAMTNGALDAISRDPHADLQTLAKTAADYANKSVPDAIKLLNPEPEVLRRLSRAKVEEVLTTKSAAAKS